MTRDVAGYLTEQQRKSSGDISQEWSTLEELYNKKLWHQLTIRLQAFAKNSIFAQGDGLVKLYQNFIADFEHRINPLALTKICVQASKLIKDPKEMEEFVVRLKEKVKSCNESVIMCLIAIANIKVKANDMEATKKLMEEAEALLDQLPTVTEIHGSVYELSSRYHKLMGNHAEYYRNALRYLGCTQLADIAVADQIERAFNLSLAAILGKGVYNFGELIAHPVLQVLVDGEKQWLVDLLYAFNSGNISRFNQLKTAWMAQPDLASHEAQMREKIALLCLMEMTFKRPAMSRQIKFDEISEETGLPLIEVELLIMKGLSLGLVKGIIDEVDSIVHMTWVQPRVLDRDQIATMQKKLEQWCDNVTEMEKLVELKAHDILT